MVKTSRRTTPLARKGKGVYFFILTADIETHAVI